MIKSYKTRFQKFSALLSNPKIAKYARQNENYAFISCYYFILLYNSNTITKPDSSANHSCAFVFSAWALPTTYGERIKNEITNGIAVRNPVYLNDENGQEYFWGFTEEM